MEAAPSFMHRDAFISSRGERWVVIEKFPENNLKLATLDQNGIAKKLIEVKESQVRFWLSKGTWTQTEAHNGRVNLYAVLGEPDENDCIPWQ